MRSGLPAFSIIGFTDTKTRQTRERVQAAVLNSGYEFPARRITVSIWPVPSVGPGSGLDLGLACALLAASGQIPGSRLGAQAFFGELTLDGKVRSAGVDALRVALAARDLGIATLVLAPNDGPTPAVVDGVRVIAVKDLSAATSALTD